MYTEYVEDLKTIKTYEAQIKKHGTAYGSNHIEEFHKYNAAKYRLSYKGLHSES